MALPVARGAYALVLRADADTALQVGRLGYFTFPRGYYIYAGSALGSGGLAARLRHHLCFAGQPHWHIDHLRRHARVVEIWAAETRQRVECHFADALAKLPGAVPVAAGFGASDCNCSTHLYHFMQLPHIAGFNRQLRRAAGRVTAYRIPAAPRPGAPPKK